MSDDRGDQDVGGDGGDLTANVGAGDSNIQHHKYSMHERNQTLDVQQPDPCFEFTTQTVFTISYCYGKHNESGVQDTVEPHGIPCS